VVCPSGTYLLIYLLTYWLTYLFIYLLAPWSRFLLEKLTGLQLVKKFPVFYGTRRFITALTNAHHLSLSWAKSIQSTHPPSSHSHFPKINPNIILPSMPGSPCGFQVERFLYLPFYLWHVVWQKQGGMESRTDGCGGYYVCVYTACIKMIGEVWKSIIFTSMVNRLINASRNERVTLQVLDTFLQMFDVCTLRHTANIKTIAQYMPYSDQQVRCDGLHSNGNSVLQIR
jgi:hypothetical protein